MIWMPIFLLALSQLTPSLCQYVYPYDAENNEPPRSDLFNPSSFRYVPPSGIQTNAGGNYVGRASTASGRVVGSPDVPRRTNQVHVANEPTGRSFATASEYFHPTRQDTNQVSQPAYEAPPPPAPVPQRATVLRTYQPPPPPPVSRPTYQPPPPPPVSRPTYQFVSNDEYEQSRRQLYADRPAFNNNYQYVNMYPQAYTTVDQFPAPFSNYERYRPTPPPGVPNTAYRAPVQHTYQAQPTAFTGNQDTTHGPASESFFRSLGQTVPIYGPAPQPQPVYQHQPVYEPVENYQYSYRPEEIQYQPIQEELQPEQPYYQPPEDNRVEEAPTPAPTRAPSRSRSRNRSRQRVSAYEPAPTARPQRQPTPPREETYVAPRPQRRPPVTAPVTDRPSRTTTFRPATIGVTSLPADVDGDGIPGEGGVDYPVLSVVPQTSFACARQPLNGYYADLETACQVVHSCQSGGIQHSFLCPNGTVFNQEMFSCQWWYRVDCAKASQYYALNDNLYRTTEAPRRPASPPARRPSPPRAQEPPRREQQPARRPARPVVEEPPRQEIVEPQAVPQRSRSQQQQRRRQRQRAREENIEVQASNRG